MGNTFSSSNALHIQPTKPFYYGGEVIEGVVALNCVTPMSSSPLKFEVVGYENTLHSTGGDLPSFDDGANVQAKHGHVEFFKISVPLESPDIFNPGQYQFGFKLHLPDTISPSFQFTRGGDRGELKYKIRAYVDNPDSNITYEHEFTVFARPPISLRPVGNVEEKSITSCFCFSQGVISVQVSLDRDCFVAGETATVTIQARNGSKKEFDCINVHLKRRIALSSAPESVHNQFVQETLVTVPLSGLRPHESAEGTTARHAPLSLPLDLASSTVKSMIQCNYFVEVELGGGKEQKSVRTWVPITILSAPPPWTVQPMQVPAEWVPSQVFPAVEVNAPGMAVPTSTSFYTEPENLPDAGAKMGPRGSS